MKLKKYMAFLTAFTFIIQAAWVIPAPVFAEVYDPVVEYQPAETEQWTGRAASAAMAAYGDKLYAYIGRMAAGGDGGLTVLDVTNPDAPVEVQDVAGTQISVADHVPSREKLCIKDGYLIVQNSVRDRLEVYRIDEADGTIDEANPLAQIQDGFRSGNASLKLFGDYLFAAGQNSDASLKIYDVANPAQIREITPKNGAVRPAMVTEDVTEQIATFTADYADLGGGTYRMYAVNRIKVQGQDMFILSIRDITIADGQYTVTTLYEGQPADTAFAGGNSGNVNDVDVVNQDCIVIVDGASENDVGMLELIDVSDPQAPAHISYSDADYRGMGAVVDNGNIIAGSQDGVVCVYAVQGTGENTAYTLEPVREIRTSGQIRQVGVYAGFIYATNDKAFMTYEYNTSISIDSRELEESGAVVTGILGGYQPGDRVAVKVDGAEYTAEIHGARFSAAVTERLAGETAAVEAQLIRGEEVLAADAKTLQVIVQRDQVYNDVTALQLAGSVSHQSGGRATDAAGLTIGGRKLMYVYTTAGLVVYDVTDASQIQELQRIAVTGQIFNSQMQLYNGYIILLNTIDGQNKLQLYKIGTDGKLLESSVQTVDLGTTRTVTIEISDEYLFAAIHGAAGTQIHVYDISDIGAGVTRLGSSAADEGAYALAVRRISDTQYQLYYIARTETDGYRFCINDMTVSPAGELQFAPAYPAVDGLQAILDRIGDIEYIGNNQIVMAFKNNDPAYVIDVSDPEAPAAVEIGGTGQAAADFGDTYALGAGNGTVTFYRKQDNAKVREISCGSQIYNLTPYDGKLLIVSEPTVFLYDGLYTGIRLDGGSLSLASTVTGTGAIEGYKAQDTIQVTVDGSAAQTAVDAAGGFTYTFAPKGAGQVSVSAALYRDGKRLLGTEQTIQIVDTSAGLPESIYDTSFTVQNPVKNSGWSTSNRQTSAALYSIGGRDYAYIGSFQNLMVYDVTDPASSTLVQENAIGVVNSQVYNKALAVRDGYIFTGSMAETGNYQTVAVYALGADGKLGDAPVASLDTGLITGFSIIDQYLFVYCINANGVIVYDISDVQNIRELGRLTGIENARAFTVEKTAPGQFRTYFIERIIAEGVSDWHLAIYDIDVRNGAASFAPRYQGVPEGLAGEDLSGVKDMAKLDGNTLAVAGYVGKYLNIYDVSNPEAPQLKKREDGISIQSVLGISDTQAVLGIEGRAVLYGLESGMGNTVDLQCSSVNQILEYKGNLVFACMEGLVIVPLKTEISVDKTVFSGTAPVLTGTVCGYRSGDILKAVIDGAEMEIPVTSDRFEIALEDLFAETDTADVRLILEREAAPLIAKDWTLQYVGAYPYAVTSADAGLTVTYTLLDPSYTDAVSVYAAVYEDGVLVDMDVQRHVTANGTWTADIADFDAQTQTVKVFIWDAGQKPAAEVYTPIIAEVSQNF